MKEGVQSDKTVAILKLKEQITKWGAIEKSLILQYWKN